MRNNQTDFLHIGEQKGYIEFLNERTTIRYVVPDKKYRFTNPEEQVRARFYIELIEHFQYSENRINLEVTVPHRTPSNLADIVVFQDDEKKDPFIVVECKKDGISEAEFEQAIEQTFGYCNSLGGHYAVVVAGNTRRSFDVKNHKPGERTENIIADPPIGYGKVQEWRYLKGVPRSELSVIERGDLIRVLEKCHDTLWQGGRLTPTDAFDELAKILFIKIRDEKKARRDGEPYDFQIKTHESPKSVANRINRLYRDAKIQDPEVFTENIEIDESRLFSVVNHLQGISLNQTDLDVKGVAFERFLGNFFKGEIGQFFTPREVVEFMVDMVTPHYEELILDPACGSGGFLCMENGKSAVVNNLEVGIGCGSTGFHVFRALEGINIHYIHALLRLKSLRKHAALHFTGSAGQQRVSSEFFKELIIPKPSIEKQTEIADYITNARNRAKQLQQEADAIIEQAKERVEGILLAEV